VKARVNGVELYYEIHGQGDWLVLAHEFSGGYKSWQPQVDALSRHCRLLVYNNRGYPPSTVPDDPDAYSQEQSIEDLRQLMDHVGVERPVLGGFSMGGSIALNFGLAHPDRIRALVLAGTGTGSIDKAQNTRDFGPIADRFLTDGPAKVGEDYLRGPTRIQLLRKNPAAWKKLYAEFSELSPMGMAYTLRGVQLKRPTMYELEAAHAAPADARAGGRGGRAGAGAEPLPGAHDPARDAGGAAEDGAHAAARGAGGVQRRRAGVHPGAARPLGRPSRSRGKGSGAMTVVALVVVALALGACGPCPGPADARDGVLEIAP